MCNQQTAAELRLAAEADATAINQLRPKSFSEIELASGLQNEAITLARTIEAIGQAYADTAITIHDLGNIDQARWIAKAAALCEQTKDDLYNIKERERAWQKANGNIINTIAKIITNSRDKWQHQHIPDNNNDTQNQTTTNLVALIHTRWLQTHTQIMNQPQQPLHKILTELRNHGEYDHAEYEYSHRLP